MFKVTVTIPPEAVSAAKEVLESNGVKVLKDNVVVSLLTKSLTALMDANDSAMFEDLINSDLEDGLYEPYFKSGELVASEEEGDEESGEKV